jgi:hypothetical protein
MPKNTAATITLAALICATLTGCAGAAENTSNERPAPTETTAPPETPEPLVAETPSGNETNDADAKFLTYVREHLLPETQIGHATDEQLIAAGHEACGQLESGVALEDVRVVDGETPHPSTGAYYDTSAILGGAILNYCPQFT